MRIPNDIMKQGIITFENKENFLKWMKIPNFFFNGKRPLDWLKEPNGKEIIMRELVNIDNGIFV